MWRRTMVMAVLALSVAALEGAAQEPKRDSAKADRTSDQPDPRPASDAASTTPPEFPGPRRGPGGPGGGFMFGGPGGFIFGGPGARQGASAMLLNLGEVQTELALEDEQKKSLSAALAELGE